MEADGEILHASLFPVQPWLDLPDLGFSVMVCANRDAAGAQRAAEKLAGETRLAIVPHATHLFEEPGTLEQVAYLARDWFLRHLQPITAPSTSAQRTETP